MMHAVLRIVPGLLAAVLLAACASVFGPVEEPRIAITSLKVLPASGIEQRIEVGLRVMNPNSFALEARGIVLKVGFNDLELLSGALADPPPVPAYSEARVDMVLTASLLNGIRLVKNLMEHPDVPLQYRLEARLDLRSPIGKRLTVLEQGQIAARPPVAAP